jgi:mRNA-degrading endonuclease RelE of RelBE toxin-antitoxin system
LVEVIWTDDFRDEVQKIRDNVFKERVKKQIAKIVNNPNIGKPLRFDMKGERTVYVKPFRLIYSIIGNKIYLLQFEHRKGVYD